jgi:pyrroline-5-carboxylate reductase
MNTRTGFFGYGSIGSKIVRGLLDNNYPEPENVFISTRHPVALTQLPAKNPSVQIAENNLALVRECNRILLCTKPLDAVHVLSRNFQ